MQHLAFVLLALLFYCALTTGTLTSKALTLLSAPSKLEVRSDQLVVIPSTVGIYRTTSHILRIRGFNFPLFDSVDAISLQFVPALIQGVDFTTVATNGNGVNVILLSGRAWRTEPGQLLLKSVDLISESGVPSRYPAPGDGIEVAQVAEDPVTKSDHNKRGKNTLSDICERFRQVLIFTALSIDDPLFLKPSDQRVYQSAALQFITITGTGFQSDLALVLDPHLEVNTDYSLTVTSPTTAVLSLLPGKKWRSKAGYLLVRAMKSGSVEYTPDPVAGTRIATVFADPAVYYTPHEKRNEAGVEHFRVASFDRHIVADVKLALDPAVAGTLRIESVLDEHVMFVEVRRDARVKDTKQEGLFTIDTGAGRVPISVDLVNTYADDDGNDDFPFEKSGSKLFADSAQSAAAVHPALRSAVADRKISFPVVHIIAFCIVLAVWCMLYTRKRASLTIVKTPASAELV